MNAVIGTLVTAMVVLGFTVVVLATRKSSPAAWTQSTLTHQFVVIGTISLGGFGSALVAQSIAVIKQQPPTATDVILIALILVAFFVVWKRLRVGATLAEYARQKENAAPSSNPVSPPGIAGAAPASEAAMPEGPNSPTRPRTPRLPKKAA